MDRINSTKMCFGCGSENPVGLHLDIESGGGLAASEWTVTENYVGWDNMLHGGILSLIADEVMGHVVDLKREKIVTAHLEVGHTRLTVRRHPQSSLRHCLSRPCDFSTC